MAKRQMSANKMRVLVLVGGTSAERDVSLASGQAVISALHGQGHEVLAIDTACGRKLLDTTRPLIPQGIATMPPSSGGAVIISNEVVSALSLPETASIDVVFLALHGGDGEDGHIQALLDMAGVPYTGSGVTASALAMDKRLAKRIFKSESIRTPDWISLDKPRKGSMSSSAAHNSDAAEKPAYDEVVHRLDSPFVVKPNKQGSTVGLSVVRAEEGFAPALAEAFHHGQSVLLEQYIPGREVTVGILGDQALPVVEIIPEHGVYDYECKYTAGKSNYVCPAHLSPEETKRLQSIATKAFRSLGCSGYGRVDFRLNSDGEFYCLEINTLPGMTSTSLVPRAAAAAGIFFDKLVETICELAIK